MAAVPSFVWFLVVLLLVLAIFFLLGFRVHITQVSTIFAIVGAL